ncbi:MAG: hypothetical protein Q8T08_16505, partial [Ignavibacteria bacterium]|nr:hypothetical protein [Ignavibacteria bacterium]
MKIFLLILIILSSTSDLFAQRERRPKLLIYTYIDRSSGNNDKGLLDLCSDAIISRFRHELNKEFPCLSVNAMNDFAVAIQHDRERALLLSEFEINLQEIIGSMGTDYLISVVLSSDGKMISLNSSLFSSSKGELGDKDNTVLKNMGEGIFDDIDEYVKKYIKEMAKQEICPYKGSFSLVTISSFMDEKQNQSTSEDGKSSSSYKSTHVIEGKDSWNLDKVSKHGATGNMIHHQKDEEKYNSVSKGRCLKYEDGSWVDIFEGWGNSSENFEEIFKSDITGLANVNEIDTKYPAVIEIQFNLTNDTYLVHVKAVSKVGKEYKTVYHQINYSCPGPPFKTINEKDIP